MKPPPRTRSKPNRLMQVDQKLQPSHKLACAWPRTEQLKLLSALKRLSAIDGGTSDIDYVVLKKDLPNRSISEIQSVVEALKVKVITSAKCQLVRQRHEARRLKKPIELWTEMALVVAGTLEEPISAAFSQMLTVSSTEPCSLRNSDPPQVHRPTTDQQKPVLRTIPFRPMPGPAVSDKAPTIIFKTPASTMGPARKLPAPFQVIRVPTATLSLPQQQSLAPGPGTSSAAASTSQTVAISHQPTTTKMVEAPAISPLRSATQTTIPNQATDSTRQPESLRLTSISRTAAFVKVMTVSTPPSQASPQPTEPQKVAREPTATTPQPQPEPHAAGVGPLSSETATVCSSTETGGPQPQQPQNTEDTSTVSSHTRNQAATPPQASPCLSPQQPPTTGSSASSLKSSSSIAVTPSSSSTSISAELSSISTIPPSTDFHSSSSNSSNPPPSTNAATPHTGPGQTSKNARTDNPRTFGVKCIVDFEKIYRYLSTVHKENEEYTLTPMESAIVLDLLMSLPEELPKLDCNSLHRHLIQAYGSLSASADSNMARGMFKSETSEKEQSGDEQHNRTVSLNRDSLQTQTESGQVTGPNPHQDRSSVASTSQEGDSNAAMDNAGKTVQPGDGQAESQSSESSNAVRQPAHLEEVQLRPLNPFMVPLKLLMRKK